MSPLSRTSKTDSLSTSSIANSISQNDTSVKINTAIEHSIDNKNNTQKQKRIQQGFDVSNRRHVLADNNIQCIIKQHGNPIFEK